VGTSSGLWEVPLDGGPWKQLHDETVTEVLDVRELPNSTLCVAFPYGVATSEPGDHGALRWTCRSHGLQINERFSSQLLAPTPERGTLIVGCEAGVLVADPVRWRWSRTSLMGSPCRALAEWGGRLWAGTDGKGVWWSEDGVQWRKAGLSEEDETVFCLAEAGGEIIAGTAVGLVVGEAGGSWRRVGPRLRVTAAAALHGTWVIGASPGGVWYSTDGGKSWTCVPGFATVRSVLPPGSDK